MTARSCVYETLQVRERAKLFIGQKLLARLTRLAIRGRRKLRIGFHSNVPPARQRQRPLWVSNRVIRRDGGRSDCAKNPVRTAQ